MDGKFYASLSKDNEFKFPDIGTMWISPSERRKTNRIYW